MLKKLLILPLLGGIMTFGAFASAGFVSDSQLYNLSLKTSTDNICEFEYNKIVGGSLPLYVGVNYVGDIPVYLSFIYEGNEPLTFPYLFSEQWYPYSSFYFTVPDNYTINCSDLTVIGSTSPVSWVDDSSSDNGGSDSDSSIIPSIPSSFTSGLTSLISNFGGILVDWLPTIILLALGITAIFALFRVVRGYSRSSFRG